MSNSQLTCQSIPHQVFKKVKIYAPKTANKFAPIKYTYIYAKRSSFVPLRRQKVIGKFSLF